MNSRYDREDKGNPKNCWRPDIHDCNCGCADKIQSKCNDFCSRERKTFRQEGQERSGWNNRGRC